MLNKNKSKPIISFISVLAVFLIAYGIGICKMEIPVEMKFLYSDDLSLNKPWHLSLTVTPMVETKNSIVNVIIPEEINIEDGNTQWNGELEFDDTLNVEVDILFPATGEYKIIGDFQFENTVGGRMGKSIALYIIITDEYIEVSEKHFSDIKRMRLKKKLEEKNGMNLKSISNDDPLYKEIKNLNRVKAEEHNLY